jgi:hypothetical protein
MPLTPELRDLILSRELDEDELERRVREAVGYDEFDARQLMAHLRVEPPDDVVTETIESCPRCGHDRPSIELRDSGPGPGGQAPPRETYGTWVVCPSCGHEWPADDSLVRPERFTS